MLPTVELVERELLRLGASPDYVGYRYLVLAIEAVIKDDTLLQHVTTHVYPAVAQQCGVLPGNVERGIRTLINMIWREGGAEWFRAITGMRLTSAPGNAKFIGMISRRIVLVNKKNLREREQLIKMNA